MEHPKRPPHLPLLASETIPLTNSLEDRKLLLEMTMLNSAETRNLDPSFTASLMPKTLDLYKTGDPEIDREILIVLMQDRALAFRGCLMVYDTFYSRESALNARGKKYDVSLHDDKYWEQANVKSNIADLIELEKKGEIDSDLLRHDRIHFRTLYYTELNEFDGSEGALDDEIAQQCQRLRELKPDATSKIVLDTLFDQYLANIHFETTRMFLQRLSYVYDMDVAKKHVVRAFATAFKPVLADKDLDTKVMMSLNLERLMMHLALKEDDPREQMALRLLAKGQGRVSIYIGEMLNDFATVYDKLGYEAPELIRVTETDEVVEIVEDAAVETEAAATEDLEAVIETTKEIIMLLEQEIAELTKQWHMTKRSRKPLFIPMDNAISQGYYDEKGVMLLIPLEPSFARERVDIIAWLNRLAQKVNGHELLKAALEAKDSLQRQVSNLRDQASKELPNTKFTFPAVPPLDTHYRAIQKDWSIHKKIIAET